MALAVAVMNTKLSS